MDERLAQKLCERVGRRGFLKGSGVLTAAFLAATASRLSVAHVGAQDQQGGSTDKQGKPTEPAADARAKDPNAPTDDVFLVVHKDESGRDYRVCPQCGFNMYRQDRTWTCENCGFTYTE